MDQIIGEYGWIVLLVLGISELLPMIPQLKANGVVHGAIDALRRLVAVLGLKKK